MTISNAVTLGPSDAAAVVAVLAAAFHDYPVMRYVLGTKPDPDRLRRLVDFFVQARVMRGETLLGVCGSRGLLAAGLVSNSPSGPSPQAFQDLRDTTWAHLGAGARRRYERFGAAAGPLVSDVPHLHLNMIGVLPEARGRGLAGIILGHVHQMSADDPGSSGVSLSTEVERNLSLYAHFGYEQTGFALVDGAFTTWAMFRPDSLPPQGLTQGSTVPIDARPS
jgi:ribosomal protein S18 acetylase RimI-like enzyme